MLDNTNVQSKKDKKKNFKKGVVLNRDVRRTCNTTDQIQFNNMMLKPCFHD